MSAFFQGRMIYRVSSFIFFAVYVLSACTTGAIPAGESVTPSTQEPTLSEEFQTEEPSERESATVVAPTSDPNSLPVESALQPFSPEPDILPTIRPDLHATDPKEVRLTSDKPQLIEFFAFW